MKIVSIYFESHFVQKNLLQFSPVGWFQLGQLQQLKMFRLMKQVMALTHGFNLSVQ